MADSLEQTTMESGAGAFMDKASLPVSMMENSSGASTAIATGKLNTCLV